MPHECTVHGLRLTALTDSVQLRLFPGVAAVTLSVARGEPRLPALGRALLLGMVPVPAVAEHCVVTSVLLGRLERAVIHTLVHGGCHGTGSLHVSE